MNRSILALTAALIVAAVAPALAEKSYGNNTEMYNLKTSDGKKALFDRTK